MYKIEISKFLMVILLAVDPPRPLPLRIGPRFRNVKSTFSSWSNPIEWVMKKSDHSGRTGLTKGEKLRGLP